MTTGKTGRNQTTPIPIAEVVICLGLFLLALLPRAYDLQRFVTADEAKWVYRSAQFLAALLSGDLAGASVNLTPAVTTTWLGSLGLSFYYGLHQAEIGLPFVDWLLSLPEFRTELPILAATRWPVVLFTSLGVVAVYGAARLLFNRTVAFTGAALIAFDPYTVALSRILGHDAPTAVFMPLSLLLLLAAVQRLSTRAPAGIFLMLSGVTAGLAFLSKAPALFLIPFAALVFGVKVWAGSATLFFWFKRFLFWFVVAYLTFVIVWPAAWVDPVGRPLAVVENAFLSATDQEEADSENYWLVPDLGPWYYVVNTGFKLSPLVLGGAVLAVVFLLKSVKVKQRISSSPHLPNSLSSTLWLIIFAILFAIFMTFGEKRSPRYILPIFPALALVAAVGWLRAMSHLRFTIDDLRKVFPIVNRQSEIVNRESAAKPDLKSPNIAPFAFSIILVVSAFVILLPYAPYYFSYFNPLVGGSITAPRWVKIGWGEGLDQVGRFLQRELPGSRVGAAYASTVAPFFDGDLSSVTGDNLDFVVLYQKQVQSGEPTPTMLRYYRHTDAIFSVRLDGLHYADVYPGPALQPALTLIDGVDGPILPKPVGFRPLSPYGRIGEKLDIDVLWLADQQLSVAPSTVTLQPLSVLDAVPISDEGRDHSELEEDTVQANGKKEILAQGQGSLTRVAPDLIISRHRLSLPVDLERGHYALLVDDRPLGEVEARLFQTPARMNLVDNTIFGEQIALTGYQFSPATDYVQINIAWQAEQSRLPDYTVFVQILEAETNQRVAGVDTRPLDGDWPTSRWVKGEVVVDEYLIAVPFDFQPGFYKVIVGLYQPQTGQRLTLADGRDHWTVPWTFIRKE